MLLTERLRGLEPVATPTGEVRLRLRGDGDRERVVPLPAGKSTVGSSPRCTLRIEQPGVAPVHCLIVHSGDRLTVRRWASETLLNGLPFDDAMLSAGDRLTIGPIEIDVLAGQSAVPEIEERTVAEDTAEDRSVASGQPRSSEGAPADEVADRWQESAAEVVFQRLRTARTLARTRSRKLLAALRHQREAHREIAERAENLERRAENLERQVQAALAEGGSLRHELEQARHGLAAAESRLGPLDSLVDERDKLAAEHQRLAKEHSRLTEENAALEERVEVALRGRQESLDALQRLEQQFEHTQTEFGQERAAWDDLRHEWQSRLADHVRQIEDLERELDGLREDQPVSAAPAAEPVAEDLPLPRGEGFGAWHDANSATPPAVQPADWPPAVGQQPAGDALAGGADEAGSRSGSAGPWEAGGWPGTVAGDAGPEVQPAAPPSAEQIAPPTGVVAEPAEARGWSDEEGTGSNLRNSDLAAVREFSLWSHSPAGQQDETHGAVEESAGEGSVAAAKSTTSSIGGHGAAAGGQSPVAPPSQTEPGRGGRQSYIERYAHLLEDDASEIEPVPAAAPPSAVGSDVASQTPGNADASDADESIEQYMAKLMQRTRGQTSTSPTPSVPTLPKPTASRPVVDQARSVSGAAGAGNDGGTPLLSLDEMKHAGRRPDQSSNLAALRSLANDIARQAIGTYAVRQYRRMAVTQIIIAVLAGATSLYLMLLSSSWWDVRCLSAGVSLVAAVYYAFLTITTLIDSVRASVFEELENDLTDVDPWHPPLPIDVEHKGPA